MQRKIWILSAFVFLISSVFAYALYMHGYNKENRNLDHGKKFSEYISPEKGSQAAIPDRTVHEKEFVAVQGKQDKINSSTLMIYQYHDEVRNKVIEERVKAPYFLMDLTRDELQELYSDWQVSSFSSEKVVLRKKIDSKYSNQYVLGVYNGFVTIFSNNEEGYPEIKEITETPISSLPLEEQNKLEKGIEIYGEEELIRMLEDYTS